MEALMLFFAAPWGYAGSAGLGVGIGGVWIATALIFLAMFVAVRVMLFLRSNPGVVVMLAIAAVVVTYIHYNP